MDRGLKLLGLWDERTRELAPGKEYHLVDTFAAELCLQGWLAREMMNIVTFMVEGLDDNPREVHAIPEISGSTPLPRGVAVLALFLQPRF